MTTESVLNSRAEVWVDPLCPWAWMTSRWLFEVERRRPVSVTVRVMSLAYLNRDREMPPEYRPVLTEGWKPVRVLIAARNLHGDQAVRDLYNEMGTRLHPGGHTLAETDAVIAESLGAVGLESLIGAATDSSLDEAVIKEHHSGVDQVGNDVGTPIVSVNGIAFFGPVVTPAPKGEDAARLWDGVLLAASTPGFYELKRSRTQGPQFD